MTDTTNDRTADFATQRDALDLSGLALLGTFGPATTPAALVRLASGRVRKVAVGDRVGHRRVAAIAPDQVILGEGRSVDVLRMPDAAAPAVG